MKKIVLTKKALVTGDDALAYLREVEYKKVAIVTGGKSMERTGVLDKIKTYMNGNDENFAIFSGIKANPTTTQVIEGALFLNKEKPDVVVAVGGGSSIDAAKAMILFYEYPELNFENVFSTNLDDKEINTLFIAIPSTSGTASEVTHVSVITSEEDEYKWAIKTENIRPDVAIIDGSLPATLPQSIAAETGMDALTHALESYINKGGNDFTDALAKEAIEGIMEFLPSSVLEGDKVAREKIHNYQCMAGMAFSNCALGMVHGVAHALGGKYNMAHGLANAIVLPYSMYYNKKDPVVMAKYNKLTKVLGKDIITLVEELREKINIPTQAYPELYNATLILQQQLEAIGVAVDLQVYDWGTMLTKISDTTAFDLYPMNYPASSAPVCINYITKTNASGFTNNPTLNQYILDMNSCATMDDAKEIWNDTVMPYCAQEVFILHLGTYEILTGVSDKVEGFDSYYGMKFWGIKVYE